MQTLLTTLGEVVTAVVTDVGDIVAVIIAHPLLLIGFGLMLLGAGVGLFKRLA